MRTARLIAGLVVATLAPAIATSQGAAALPDLTRHLGFVPGADRRLYPVMERYLDRILQAMPREDGLIGAVRKCLGEALREGAPTLGQVAAQLGVSARTLQRQLHDRGVDFSGLVEDTRRRFAMQYLDDRANTLTDVAFLLGYSEVSAFNRAFKRWTGSTPSGYRRRRQTLGAWRARTTKVRSSSRDRPGYH